MLLPAYNEQAGIVESVRSLIRLRYPLHEVIVVNDGSRDGTLALLEREFALAPIAKALRDSVSYKPVRGVYASRRHPNLLVIDKDNGGKADALNCGIAAATHPYFCAIDADAVLEEEALLDVAKPLLDDPELVAATGGIVRILNGCRIEHGEVVEVGLPRSRLATLQVVEYFRAFLVGRVGWSRLRSLLIISGAFGLFRRADVEAVGGYATDTVGEDAELVVRLHQPLRERGEDYRIEFVPDPVCWTEAPEDLRTLAEQRRRWQRGLAETLWRHRALIGRSRYGAFGVLALPYFLVFELLGPLVELLAFVALPLAFAAGALSASFFVAFLLVAVMLGMLLSIAALALEELELPAPSHQPRGAADAGLRAGREPRLPPAGHVLAGARVRRHAAWAERVGRDAAARAGHGGPEPRALGRSRSAGASRPGRERPGREVEDDHREVRVVFLVGEVGGDLPVSERFDDRRGLGAHALMDRSASARDELAVPGSYESSFRKRETVGKGDHHEIGGHGGLCLRGPLASALAQEIRDLAADRVCEQPAGRSFGDGNGHARAFRSRDDASRKSGGAAPSELEPLLLPLCRQASTGVNVGVLAWLRAARAPSAARRRRRRGPWWPS